VKNKEKNQPKPEQTHHKKPKNKPTGARPNVQTQQTHGWRDPVVGLDGQPDPSQPWVCKPAQPLVSSFFIDVLFLVFWHLLFMS
jgi:hypothetical protein